MREKFLSVMKYLPIVLLIIHCVVIFNFSAQSATESTETSTTVVEKVLDVVNGEKEVTKEDVKKAEPVARSIAHFMLFFVLARKLYTITASKSIYTLRRLPEKGIEFRYFILMPMLYSIICLLAGFLVLTIYFAIYMLATPNECITAAQWYKIWRL